VSPAQPACAEPNRALIVQSTAPWSPSSWSWPWLRAAAVHVYTATGAVLALLIVMAAIEGDAARALWLGLAALVIDGTDGMLARRFRVKERIPWFDGATLDNIVDYLTYVFAPVVLLLQGGYLPAGGTGTLVAAIPLVASAYQFCRVDAKADPGTDDHFFRGFPSYWNVVAFYAIALDLDPGVVSATVLVCALLVPVPIGYLYPSRTRDFRPLTLALSAVWLAAYAVIVAQLPDPHPFWLALSLGYIGYYVGLSLLLEARRRAARSTAAAVVGTVPG
jgi:phosphatidylcholine synthase